MAGLSPATFHPHCIQPAAVSVALLPLTMTAELGMQREEGADSPQAAPVLTKGATEQLPEQRAAPSFLRGDRAAQELQLGCFS